MNWNDESDVLAHIEDDIRSNEMSKVAVKPETIIKRRMSDALDEFRTLYGREMGNEEHVKESKLNRYRVTLSGPTRFSCGQAKYEGQEGTWLCWFNRAGIAISGTPWQKDDKKPSFGLYEELDLVGDRSDEDLHKILWGKELVFECKSGLTLVINRTSSVDVQYEIVWRDKEQKRIHNTYYTGFDAFQAMRDGESLSLSNFRIADIYKYQD